MRPPRTSRRPVVFVVAALLGLVSVLAACGASAPSADPTYPADAVVISAKDLRFSTDQLVVPAGKKFTLVFKNLEAVPHNVRITTERDGKGDLLFRHDFITNQTGVFEVGPISAGTWYFECEVHPQMNGVVLAQ